MLHVQQNTQFVYSEEFIKVHKRLQIYSMSSHEVIGHGLAILKRQYSCLLKDIIFAFTSTRTDFMGEEKLLTC